MSQCVAARKLLRVREGRTSLCCTQAQLTFEALHNSRASPLWRWCG